MEACCAKGDLCGAQISTVGVCIEARILESVVFAADASPADPLADATRPWDGATPMCPVHTGGGRVSGADCYACIPAGAPCTPQPQGSPYKGFGAADCAALFSNSPDFQCEWYPDGVAIGKSWGFQTTCLSNPGRVICGGGL